MALVLHFHGWRVDVGVGQLRAAKLAGDSEAVLARDAEIRAEIRQGFDDGFARLQTRVLERIARAQ